VNENMFQVVDEVKTERSIKIRVAINEKIHSKKKSVLCYFCVLLFLLFFSSHAGLTE
jgi:hypothetical protein